MCLSQGGLDKHLAVLAPGLQKSLLEKGPQASALRTEALAFLKSALAKHPAPAFRPLLPQLLPPVLATVEDRYYKARAGTGSPVCIPTAACGREEPGS